MIRRLHSLGPVRLRCQAFPFLAVALAALLAASCSGCRTRPSEAVEPLPPRSNILLITVDTLRADHLSSYGYPRQTTPVIDRLASEGVRFDQAAVQWPKTTPSFASLFTATYSKDNGIVRKVGNPIPCRFRTLAEMLRRQGYGTYAVVANGALGSEFHFDQGFDKYVETWKVDPPAGIEDPNVAGVVTRLADGLLEHIDRSKPFFLWLHYLDPHFPYDPPAPWRDRFQGDAHYDASVKVPIFREKTDNQMSGIGMRQVLDNEDELAFYVARYDAEIAYTDAQIGHFLETLRAAGLMQHTMTVFTADHGESLGDHAYYFDHGRFGFQACLHVPLIVNYPGVVTPGVDHQPVELIDVAPTLLQMAGVSLDDGTWMQGRSLLPRLRHPLGGADADSAGELAFSEAGWETKNHWQKVVRDRRFKLIFAQTVPEQRWIGGEGVRFVLYDLANDPGETKNVADRYPEELERLKRALWGWENAERFPVLIDTEQSDCSDAPRKMDHETEELLRSLGYL